MNGGKYDVMRGEGLAFNAIIGRSRVAWIALRNSLCNLGNQATIFGTHFQILSLLHRIALATSGPSNMEGPILHMLSQVLHGSCLGLSSGEERLNKKSKKTFSQFFAFLKMTLFVFHWYHPKTKLAVKSNEDIHGGHKLIYAVVSSYLMQLVSSWNGREKIKTYWMP